MKKLVYTIIAAIAVTASVSFASCTAKDQAALDSLANALDADTLVLDSAAAAIDSAVVDTAVAE